MVLVNVSEFLASLAPVAIGIAAIVLVLSGLWFWLSRNTEKKKLRIALASLFALITVVIGGIGSFASVSAYQMTEKVEQDIVRAIEEKEEGSSYEGSSVLGGEMHYFYSVGEDKNIACTFDPSPIISSGSEIVLEPRGEGKFEIEYSCKS